MLALWYAKLAAVCVIVVLLDMLSAIAREFIINSVPGTHDWMPITVSGDVFTCSPTNVDVSLFLHLLRA